MAGRGLVLGRLEENNIRAPVYIYIYRGKEQSLHEVSKKARGRKVGVDLTVKRTAWRG